MSEFWKKLMGKKLGRPQRHAYVSKNKIRIITSTVRYVSCGVTVERDPIRRGATDRIEPIVQESEPTP